MEQKIIKIFCGDITKRLNFDLINSYEQLLEKAKISFNLRNDDKFELYYNKKKISEKDFPSFKNSNKIIKLELILDEGNYILISSQYNLNSGLKKSLEGTFKNFINPEEIEKEIEKSNLNMIGQQLDNVIQNVNEIRKIVYQEKIDFNIFQKNLTNSIKNLNENFKTYFKQESFIPKSNLNDNNNFNLECSNCNNVIYNVKYECLFCKKNLVLCQKCSEKHEHPLLQFYLNVDYKQLKNCQSVKSYFEKKSEVLKKNTFSQSKSDFLKVTTLNPSHNIELSLLNIHPLKIAISKEENCFYIHVLNNYSKNIKEQLSLNFEGQKNISIKCFNENKELKPFDNYSIKCIVYLKDDLKDYEETINISLIKGNNNIDCDPIIITIYVAENSNSAKIKNIDFFLEYNNYNKNISSEKRKKMISLIENKEDSDTNKLIEKLNEIVRKK